jgi:hypothetical protein
MRSNFMASGAPMSLSYGINDVMMHGVIPISAGGFRLASFDFIINQTSGYNALG